MSGTILNGIKEEFYYKITFTVHFDRLVRDAFKMLRFMIGNAKEFTDMNYTYVLSKLDYCMLYESGKN